MHAHIHIHAHTQTHTNPYNSNIYFLLYTYHELSKSYFWEIFGIVPSWLAKSSSELEGSMDIAQIM